MRKSQFAWGFGLLAVSAIAQAAPPEYVEDPFGDADFEESPLIYNIAHPTRGRTEVSLMFSGSVVDKYTNHLGGLVDIGYHFTESMGLAASFGFMRGGLTTIVTDQQGVLGNKIAECGDDCNSIDPNLPDYNQVTGMADALFVWSPLYGKINVVSELAVSMQLYGLAGVGLNGTRRITAARGTGPDGAPYLLQGGELMEGGAFSNSKVHVTAGAGLKIFVLDWLALRSEFRAIAFRDEFEFEPGRGPQSYTSAYWFGQGGLSFLF